METLVIAAQLQAMRGLSQSAKPDLHRAFDGIPATMIPDERLEYYIWIFHERGFADR